MTQPNIFQELERDIEQQKLEDMWRKFGPYVVACAVVIVLATAIVAAWKNYSLQQSQSATRELMALVDAKKEGNALSADALETFAQQNMGKTQAGLALFRAASVAAKDNNTDKAVSLYEKIASDATMDVAFRHLAGILAVEIQMDRGDADQLLKKLEPYRADAAPWKAMAQENAGFLYIKIGDKDSARKVFTDLVHTTGLPRTVSERAQTMLNSLSN